MYICIYFVYFCDYLIHHPKNYGYISHVIIQLKLGQICNV